MVLSKPLVPGLTPDVQLEKWVAGESLCPNTRDECCPDFSCCRPKLQWDEAKRVKFRDAEQGEREKMMMGALGAVISLAFEEKSEKKKVRITRGNPADDE